MPLTNATPPNRSNSHRPHAPRDKQLAQRHPNPTQLNSNLPHPLIESQTRIGWDQFILGRWSSKWQQFQRQYISTQSFKPTNTNHGIGWASNLIRLIWEKCQGEWHTRNEARHGQDDAAQQQICLARALRQIRALYELKDSCFYHGRMTYCKTSPEAHFAQVTQVHCLKNWITMFEPMIRAEVHTRSEILRRHEGQTFIDEYFSVNHRMPRPIQLGQAGELQSLTPLDGG
jgi:hypothetical protein